MLVHLVLAAALSASPTLTPVCAQDHKAPAEHRRQQTQLETGLQTRLDLLEMAEKTQRRTNDRLEELQWQVDKTQQETETLQTQMMLRGLDQPRH